MRELETLRKIINPSIKMNKLCLSYIIRLFPEYKDLPCIILYKEQPIEFINNHSKYIDDTQTSSFNMTGSPLKYTFDDCDFEDTFISMKQNWSEEEEKYFPLSRAEACNALNACIKFITDSFPPIFALCDGKDIKKSRLLGTIIQGEWFITIEVYSTGIETLNTIKKSSTILQQHLKFSHVHEHDVTKSAVNTFDLFGTKAIINCNKNAKCNFEGSLSVEMDSSSLLYPLIGASKNNLVAQVVTGSDGSPLKNLWKQLLLLNQYLSIIEVYKKNTNSDDTSSSLEFPHDFTSPYKEEHDTIMQNLNLLFSENYNFRNVNNIESYKMKFLNEQCLENNVKIQQRIQNLSYRYNLDFTDLLWELLIKNSNYFEMTKCIHTVLEKIIICGCLDKIKVNFTNSTKFAKIIINPPQQKIISHLLSGSLPLEYVIDMGFEKLCRDYIYILMNTRFGELYDIQQNLGNVSPDEFTIDFYRKKLIYMAQIHLCLEFMLLFENNLICSIDDLRTMFLCTFKQYVCEKSPIQNYHELHENTIHSLTIPLPLSVINSFNTEIPTTRRILLSSQSKLSKLTTIKYYTQLPIFPTTIYPLDDSNIIDEAYYITNAICSFNKYK